MNELVWCIDEALLGMAQKPIAVIGVVLGVLLGITTALVIYSLGRSK